MLIGEGEGGVTTPSDSGLDAFRLANKRLKHVLESCTTRLTNQKDEDGPDSLPIPIIQSRGRVEEIKCYSNNLRSLEGCPDGLKKLWIGDAPHLSDFSPLASCSMKENLDILNSSIISLPYQLVQLLRLFQSMAALSSPAWPHYQIYRSRRISTAAVALSPPACPFINSIESQSA